MERIKIEPAEEKDLEKIIEIEENTFHNTAWALYMFEYELRNKDSIFWVAKIQDTVTGYIIMRKIEDEGHIMNLAVDEKYRNMGIGKKLISEVIRISTEMGLRKLTLEVHEENLTAINLYEKFGFEKVGMRKNYYKNRKNALIMTKKLFLIISLLANVLFSIELSHKIFFEGLIYKSKGDIHKAIELLELAKKLDPESVHINLELAKLYLVRGKISKAKQLLNECEKNMREEDTEVELEIANLKFILEPEDGVKYYEKIHEKDKTNAELIYKLALYYSLKDPQKALNYINEFLILKEDDFNGLLLKGKILQKLNKLDEAIKCYKDAIKINPISELPYIQLAEIYIELKKYEDAARSLEPLLHRDPINLTLITTLLNIYKLSRNTQKLGEMINNYILKHFKDTDISYYWLSILEEQKGNYKTAIKYLIRVKNKTYLEYIRLGHLHLLTKDNKKAISYAKKALALSKEDSLAHLLLGLAYFELKNYKLAEKYLLKTYELNNFQLDAVFYLASIYEINGDYEKCELYFRRALEIEPEHPSILNNLGYTLVEQNKNLDEAESLIRKALEKEPDNAAFIDSLGWLYYKQGKYEEAESELMRANQKLKDPVILEHLGDTKMKLKKYDEAIKYWKEALKLNPRNKKTIKEKIKNAHKITRSR